MPTPESQEVEWAREVANLILKEFYKEYSYGLKSGQPSRMARAIEGAAQLIAQYHAASSAEERRRRQAGKTHWDGCWKDHLDCAVENVAKVTRTNTGRQRTSASLMSKLKPI